MKIEFELPKFAEERNLYFMAGIELMAYKTALEKRLFIKTGHCSQCGRCCMAGNIGRLMPKNPETGDCLHLQRVGEKYYCGLGDERPFGCNKSKRPNKVPECTVTFEEVPIK